VFPRNFSAANSPSHGVEGLTVSYQVAGELFRGSPVGQRAMLSVVDVEDEEFAVFLVRIDDALRIVIRQLPSEHLSNLQTCLW
jgi:hypothetical protein